MKEWREMADTAEFEATDRKLVELDAERHVVVFKIGDEYYAVDAWCSHEKASLAIGEVTDHELMCPLHGARFDLRTGRHLSLPAVRPIGSYPVRIENGRVLVRI